VQTSRPVRSVRPKVLVIAAFLERLPTGSRDRVSSRKCGASQGYGNRGSLARRASEEGRGFPRSRSHAPRGNALSSDALRRCSARGLCPFSDATQSVAEGAFPRGAWNEDASHFAAARCRRSRTASQASVGGGASTRIRVTPPRRVRAAPRRVARIGGRSRASPRRSGRRGCRGLGKCSQPTLAPLLRHSSTRLPASPR